jgi:hypothetical protein
MATFYYILYSVSGCLPIRAWNLVILQAEVQTTDIMDFKSAATTLGICLTVITIPRQDLDTKLITS